MELIDKDAVIAEIEKQLDELWNLLPNASNVIKDNYTKEEANIIGKYTTLESFENFINTLEVKEVDLEKEIEEHVESMPMSEFTHESEVDAHWDWAREEFRHFFELGLKAQKGE